MTGSMTAVILVLALTATMTVYLHVVCSAISQRLLELELAVERLRLEHVQEQRLSNALIAKLSRPPACQEVDHG